HYNQTRAEYYRQLDQASSTGDPVPFIEYAIRGFVDGLRSQLMVVREQQYKVAWESYVYGLDGKTNSESDRRRRHLLMELYRAGKTPIAKLSEVSPRMAGEYARLAPRTLMRDVEKLLSENLVCSEDGSIRANTDLIKAFLPARRRAARN